MSILIDTIRIAGFRGIKNLEISFPRVTVLIGANNSGKTSVLKAMQLALGDYSRHIAEEDFYIAANGKRATEIIVDIRVVSVDNKGIRVQNFNEEWMNELSDKIQSEANNNQFVALRTRVKPDFIKGGFDTSRTTLLKWADFTTWQTEKITETKPHPRLLSIPVIAIEAQRDIHQELREKSSFVGKVLSSVDYSSDDVTALEELIREVNETAVGKSDELKKLKMQLEKLNESFQGNGNAEITPFPKKIRDLSKHFSIHFGESSNNTFSMEYHGMGTRSWASMLTVKAFTDLMIAKHEKEAMPYSPIITAEEPEAHLHPNAQKTLYRQLAETQGQVVISTHSPYLVAMADITQIRSLRNEALGIVSNALLYQLSDEEKKIIAREIASKRGEIVFSKVLILCEGITEEQLFPVMFEVYSGKSMNDLGISCISVSGKNYPPFVKLACSFGIPTFIISDNDGLTKIEVEAQLRRLKRETGLRLETGIFGVSYLSENNDLEAELLQAGLKDEIILALALAETNGTKNIRYMEAKLKEINKLLEHDILLKMRESKSSYSGFLADVLRDNPNKKNLNELLPSAVVDAFNAAKGWS